MLAIRPAGKRKLSVEIDAGPRIAEVGDPRYTGGALHAARDQVHTVGRARADNGIDRMLLHMVLEELDRRLHPPHPGIGNEEVAAHPQGKVLLPSSCALLAEEGGLHPFILASACEPLVEAEGLGDGALDHLHRSTHILHQARILSGHLGVGRRVHDWPPPILGQVLAHLQPTIHTCTTVGRPVIADDEHPLHAAGSSVRTRRNKAPMTSNSTAMLAAMLTFCPVR